MPEALVIVESPAKAKTIGNILVEIISLKPLWDMCGICRAAKWVLI